MSTARSSASEYVHEAFFYDGDRQFVSSSAEFVRDGLRQGEHPVVAVLPDKGQRLRTALGKDGERVTFLDMAACGRNPARIIQVWRDVVDAAALQGAGVRGIGEPIWAGRTREELLEAELHEALLNAAFHQDSPLRLRCPYDVSSLDPAVVATAHVTHPQVADVRGRATSGAYAPGSVVDSTFSEPLAEPPTVEQETPYGPHDLLRVRRLVGDAAAEHGLDPDVTAGLVLAAREIAVNSVRHGGGAGRLRIWTDDATLVCELSDSGHIAQEMVGRLRPAPECENGRGVWLVNQLCDLVQIRTSRQGTVVRLHAVRSSARSVAG